LISAFSRLFRTSIVLLIHHHCTEYEKESDGQKKNFLSTTTATKKRGNFEREREIYSLERERKFMITEHAM